MATNRKAKLKKAAEKERRQRIKVRESFDQIVPLVGADELFRRFTEDDREAIRRLRFPAPEILLGDELKHTDQGHEARSAVAQAIDRFTFRTPDGREISATDYFRVVLSLKESIGTMRVNPPDSPLARLVAETGKTVMRLSGELLFHQFHQLLADFDMALAEFTRIDTAIYWYQPEYLRVGPGKGLFRVTIRKAPPNRARIVVDGESRPAFQSGASFGVRGVAWIELPAKLLGADASGSCPLYVQSHAIRQLHERVPISDAGLVHDAMWQSFAEPRIVRNRRGQTLVEYRFFQHRLGYFLIEPVDGNVLARTFLFLTMEGTPEGDVLHERLRLKRRDIEQLDLDKLQTYVMTDLQQDAGLVEILDGCGCGHLLRMSRPETRSQWVPGFARDVRKYLGMTL